MFEAAAVSPDDAIACPHCAPMRMLDLGPAALPAEQESPGATINGKPVRDLDWIHENFSRLGTRWDEGEVPTTHSTPVTLPSDYRDNDGVPVSEGVDFSPMTAMQVLLVHLAMDLLDEIIAPDFAHQGTSWGAGLRFMNTISDTGSAHAVPPQWGRPEELWGDIWIHANAASNFDMDAGGVFAPIGSQALTTMIHEIGHTMGPVHPGNYDAGDEGGTSDAEDAAYFQDSLQYTVMSYFGASATEPAGVLGMRPNT